MFHHKSLFVGKPRRSTKNFDLKAAEHIFKVNYYNRRAAGVNSLLDTYEKHEVARKYESYGILGFAKDGSLVRYVGAGRLDFYGFIMSMSCFELCVYFSHMLESDIKMMKDQSLKTGKEVHSITFIIDLEGFSIQQVLHKNVVEMGTDYVRLIQDSYPEIWSNLLVVNAPKIFDKAFYIFKPFMRAPVLERLVVADKGSTKDLLLKYIDEDILPGFLGGKRVDSNGDPQCKEFISLGGKVPENMYSNHSRIPLSPSDPDVKCFTIGPRSVYNMCIPIQQALTRMRFQLRTENGSIYFSIFYKEFGSDPNDLELPEENEFLDENSENYTQCSVEIRIQAHCTQEDFTIPFYEPGIYILKFNNSNSWFASRKLKTKVELFPPKQGDVS